MSKSDKRNCIICDEIIKKDSIFLHKTRRQTHILCRECGVGYLSPLIEKATENLRNNIRDKVTIIKCPGTYHGQLRNKCIKNIDIRDIFISDKLPLYTSVFRILYTLSNANLYLCPSKDCGEIVETHPDHPISRTMCQTCNFIWCRLCQTSPYHEGMSCLEYECFKNNTENGKFILEKKLKGDLEFCPSCRVPTEKVKDENGTFVSCNKIICSQCNSKWCWLCKAVDIDYDHYNEKSKNHCANKLWYGTNINKT
jgi:hypothetical protein